MNTLFQFLLTNWPTFAGIVGFGVIFYKLVKLDHKMEIGFKDVRAEMREGLLKVSFHLQDHDCEIKRIKRKLKDRRNNSDSK